MRIRDGITGLTCLGLRPTSLPILRDRRPALPSRDRTVIGVGRPGCFETLDVRIAAILPDGGPYRLDLLARLYEHDRRFHVVRKGGWDLAFYAPEGTSFQPYCDVRGHLDRAFEVVSGLGDCTVLAEWGSHPDMPQRLAMLAESGEPAPGMPCLALTCAQLSRYAKAPFDARRTGDCGPASQAFGGSVVMFAVEDDAAAATSVLEREVRRFSRTTASLRPISSAPAETLVADMGEGCITTLSRETAFTFSNEPQLLRA